MRDRALWQRLGWSAWALIPVALIAFHFGPGRTLAAREVAAARFREATALERTDRDNGSGHSRQGLPSLAASNLIDCKMRPLERATVSRTLVASICVRIAIRKLILRQAHIQTHAED